MSEREYLDAQERSIGLIYLCREPHPTEAGAHVYEAWIDGELLMSDVSPLSERVLAVSAIEAHPGEHPLRVLIGGLGLGHTAAAALESPRVGEVCVVDAMDFVIGWFERGLVPLAATLIEDPRCRLVRGDVYADVLAEPSQTWDLILIDVDHSPALPLDPANLPFYTPEGQRAVGRHLAPGGILAVWSAHDNDAFAGVMTGAYPAAWRESVEWVVPYNDGPDMQLRNTLFFGRSAG